MPRANSSGLLGCWTTGQWIQGLRSYSVGFAVIAEVVEMLVHSKEITWKQICCNSAFLVVASGLFSYAFLDHCPHLWKRSEG